MIAIDSPFVAEPESLPSDKTESNIQESGKRASGIDSSPAAEQSSEEGLCRILSTDQQIDRLALELVDLIGQS